MGGQPAAERGFSLLMLSVWLLGLGLALAMVLSLLPNTVTQDRLARTIDTLEVAHDHLLAFVTDEFRLPAPDETGDGLEDPAATFGVLPYRSMGLPASVRDPVSVPLVYVPYRNEDDSADLAVNESLYEPELPDGTDYGCPANPASPVNLLDFCVALANGRLAAASDEYAGTGPGPANQAYVVASSGLADSDADSDLLDTPNATGTPVFEDPVRGREVNYDDIIRPRGFSALERELSCPSLLGSLDLLVATAFDSQNVADNAEYQLFQANVQVALDTFAEVMRAVTLANAIAAAAGAVATATEICAVAAACLGLCVNITAACVAAVAASVSATAAAVAAGVDLVAGAVLLAVTIANRDEVEMLRDATFAHLCDALADVTAADQRGGLR